MFTTRTSRAVINSRYVRPNVRLRAVNGCQRRSLAKEAAIGPGPYEGQYKEQEQQYDELFGDASESGQKRNDVDEFGIKKQSAVDPTQLRPDAEKQDQKCEASGVQSSPQNGRPVVRKMKVNSARRNHETPAISKHEVQREGPRFMTWAPASDKPESFNLNITWLRDACRCPQCVDRSTSQKNFRTADIPGDLKVRAVETTEQGLKIRWENDVPEYGEDHVSEYSTSFLRHNQSVGARARARFDLVKPRLWDAKRIHEHKIEKLRCEYGEYVEDDRALLHVLANLKQFGLAFIHNVPEDEVSVRRLANRIGPLRNSFYGETWDVKSVPEAKNVAYTHHRLDLHMDLLYMKHPPHLQFLHCMKNSCTGGESVFVDSFHAAQTLLEKQPALYTALCEIPVAFHYRNAGEHYHQIRPTFDFGYGVPTGATTLSRGTAGGERPVRSTPLALEVVNWSPPFQGPFDSNVGLAAQEGRQAYDMDLYREAAAAFTRLLDEPANQLKHLLRPGECVIFNNRRVLHARAAFDNDSGERWLKGAYVDSDPFDSRFRVLTESFAAEPKPRRDEHSRHLLDAVLDDYEDLQQARAQQSP